MDNIAGVDVFNARKLEVGIFQLTSYYYNMYIHTSWSAIIKTVEIVNFLWLKEKSSSKDGPRRVSPYSQIFH